MVDRKVVSSCPVCGSREVVIRGVECTACSTRLETEIPVPPFFALPPDLQHFVMVFLRRRGNIREVERELGISYPTVCKRLDQVNQLLGDGAGAQSKTEVLERLERGEITAKEAARLLRELG